MQGAGKSKKGTQERSGEHQLEDQENQENHNKEKNPKIKKASLDADGKKSPTKRPV